METFARRHINFSCAGVNRAEVYALCKVSGSWTYVTDTICVKVLLYAAPNIGVKRPFDEPTFGVNSSRVSATCRAPSARPSARAFNLVELGGAKLALFLPDLQDNMARRWQSAILTRTAYFST